jgi:hypothetical protein
MVSAGLDMMNRILHLISFDQVRAAQSLTLLSHSLKLSLLLTQEPVESSEEGLTALDEEAIELIKSTAREKQRCARLLEDMFGLPRASDDVVTKESASEGVYSAGATGSEANGVNAPEAKGETQPPIAEEPKEEEDLEMTLV